MSVFITITIAFFFVSLLSTGWSLAHPEGRKIATNATLMTSCLVCLAFIIGGCLAL